MDLDKLNLELKKLGLSKEHVKILKIKGEKVVYLTYEGARELYRKDSPRTDFIVDLVMEGDSFKFNEAKQNVEVHNYNPNVKRGALKAAYLVFTDYSGGRKAIKNTSCLVGFEVLKDIKASFEEKVSYSKEFLELVGDDFFKKEVLEYVAKNKLKIPLKLPLEKFPDIEEKKEVKGPVNEDNEIDECAELPEGDLIGDIELPPIPKDEEAPKTPIKRRGRPKFY
jgi:hypothetical protein